jgi:hypothetical protein
VRVLLLAAALVPACVVPLGPDFQNPPAAENSPPLLLSESPLFGSETTTSTFRVTVTDPNGGDDLYIRWVSDYPPISAMSRALFAPVTIIPHRADGVQQYTPIEMTVDCVRDFLPRGITRHQIQVLVGDADFAPESTELSLLKNQSHAVYNSWVLDRQCPGDAPP